MKKATKLKLSLVCVAIAAVLGFLYYYITLPAINMHSVGFWKFIIVLFIILTITSCLLRKNHTAEEEPINLHHINVKQFIQKSRLTQFCLSITLILIVVFIIGYILSSPIVNAKKYRQLINIETGNFQDDIKQISYNEIPLLDKDSATLLGSRKIGSMVEYVSQFEVSKHYTQINYNNTPVRVTPLEYGNIFKWFSNRSEGIPAYVSIDMATQKVECIKLDKGIKYSDSEHFGRYIYRYLRFKFPTYIFDNVNFEIDDKGTPYWICPVKSYKIGLFGGEYIKRAVLVNAITGETTDYAINKVPTWVDQVYSSDLLISYYDYYGTLKHGYLNTLFSQKGCLQTTEGYNYIAIDDDVWLYTGVTSVGGDESLVGFVLCNQRTAETKYYSMSGAKEYSAMDSAEGKVQNLNYKATFPLLLNIANEPTYVMTLKDSAGLVKKYAMVNIEQYTVVAIGDSITECEKNYINLLRDNHVVDKDADVALSLTGTIKKISQAVIDGNTHYYLILDGYEPIFDVLVADNINVVKYSEGDKISISYTEGTDVDTVVEVK